MAADSYIYHVPLQSGTTCNFYRAEMDAILLEEQIALIGRSLIDGARVAVPIERLPGYSLAGWGTARVAEFLISRTGAGAVVRAALAVKRPTRPNIVEELYLRLVAESELPVHPAVQKPPRIPWYATRMEHGGEGLSAKQLLTIRHFMQSLPWAWIEYHRLAGDPSRSEVT